MEICVFSTVNKIKADMVKNALDENKIDNYLKNQSANALGLGGWTVDLAGGNLAFGDIKVMVKENDHERALEIVKTLFGNDNEYSEEVEKNVFFSEDSENEEIKLSQGSSAIIENKIKDENIANGKNKKLSAGKKFLIFIGIVFFVMILFTIYMSIPSFQISNSTVDSRIAENDLVGTWVLEKTENGIKRNPFKKLEFFQDGTGIMDGNEITWQLKDGRRLYRNSNAIGSSEYDIELSENGTLLIYHYDGRNYKGNLPQKAMYRKMNETITQRYYYEIFLVSALDYLEISVPSFWDMSTIKDYRNKLRGSHSILLYSTADASESDIFTVFSSSGYTPSETTDIISYINNIGVFILWSEYRENPGYVHVVYLEKDNKK